MGDTTQQYNFAQMGNIDPDLYDKQQALNRQQQMAQLLMQQSQQAPQGQIISGRYVAPSFTQNLANLAQAGVGAYLQNKGDKQALEIAKELRKTRMGVQEAFSDAINTNDMNKALQIASANPDIVGKEAYSALINAKVPKTPEKVAEYNFAKQNGFKGEYNDFVNQITPAKQAELDLKKQELALHGAKFAFEKEQAAGGAKLTESQSNATGFGVRAKESNAILNQLEGKGVQHPGFIRQTATGAVQNVPIIGKSLENAVGSTLNVLPSAIGGTNADQQAFLAAKKNFITAILRKESGATIQPSEFADEEKKYFAQIGDDPAVVRQKQHARETAIQALKFQAGPGAKFINEFKPQTDFSDASKKVVNFNDLP
jgi:hypothetical protein